MVQEDQPRNPAGDERDSEELAAHEAERKALEKARDPVDTGVAGGDDDSGAANLHYGSHKEEILKSESDVNEGDVQSPASSGREQSDAPAQESKDAASATENATPNRQNDSKPAVQSQREVRNDNGEASGLRTPKTQSFDGADANSRASGETASSNAGEAAVISIARGGVNEAPFDIALSNDTVDENLSGAKIADLSSSDFDAGDSATYAITDDPSGLFEIVGTELRLKEGASFDFEAQPDHAITLTVTDAKGATYQETFTITVGDANEAPEALSLSNASVDENTAGAVIGDLSLTDVDDGDSHTFAVDDARFEVVGGRLKLKDGVELNHEDAASIEVTVTATDSGGLSTNETFSIAVGDVNEAPEALSLSNASVDENTAGAVIGDLSLTDVDDGDSHTFAVDDARFEVVGGQLKLKDGVELNHEDAASIDVTVTATDNGGLSTNETFSIAVGDVNEAPEALSLSNASVDENTAGAVIGDLSLTDVDDGDSHTFAVDDARFEVVGGQLKLKDGVELNHEEAASIDVTVTATDSGGLSTNETFSIAVGDVNEAPEALSLSNASVNENTAGAVIGDLSLTDVDDGDSHTYAVDDARFEVVGGQLKLKDGVELNHEAAASIDVTVTATDNGGLSTNETFSIAVGDANEAPEALSLSNASVDENTAGAVIGDLSLTDVDDGDSHTYAVDDARFEVVGGQLKLKDGVELNHEEAASIDVTVTATDNGGLSTNETFTIAVGDVNEAPDALSLSNASVNESTAGAVIGDLSLTDVDDGDSHTFAVDDARFEVVGGQLKLKDGVELNHEEAASIDVTVTATDNGGLSTNETFTIAVGDVNEAPTDIEFVSVRQVAIENAGFEDTTYGDQRWGRGATGWESSGSSGDWNPAARSLAEEASEGSNVAWINSGSLAQTVDETFSQDGEYTLSVDVGNRQDISSFGEYEVRLYAGDELVGSADGGAPAEGGWQTVTLTVNGSDFATDFAGFGENLRIELVKVSGGQVNFDNVQLGVVDPTSEMFVPENQSGAQIAVLSGIDPDDGDSHSFVVSDDRFEVVDGALKLKNGVSLNHEEADSVDIVITVTDAGGLSYNESFSISVGDVNETPESLTLSNSSIDENSAGAVIGSLSLSDVDDGDSHSYAVDDARFEVVGGELKLKDGVELNHEEAASIDVTVTATDSGGLTTSETFALSVGDVNEAPTEIGIFTTRQIDVDNAGFENRAYGDQRWGRGTPEWETSGSSGDWNPAARSLAAEASEGSNVAWINSGSLAQTVDEAFSADSNYELSVDVGNRQDISGFGEYEIRLYAGDELVGSADGGAPAEGGWETVTLNVNGSDFAPDFAGFGENLRIELVKVSGGQVNFDNVQLTAIDVSHELGVEENAPGAIIANLGVIDPDAGDSHSFVVDDPRFEVVDSQLKLKDGVELNHEAAASIDVTVTATDSGGLSTNQTFSVAVGDVNEAPEALSLSNATVDENSAGAVIGDLSLTDADDGDSHSYAVDDARFEVVGGQLKLKDGVELNHEEAASIDVTVTATDSGGLSTNETFSIAVGDVNEAPETLSLSNATVDENSAGAVIGDLSLTDVDDGDSHSYAVDDARFEVVGGQLKLKEGVELNHEEAASIDVTVTATDSGGLSTNETFSIAVGDVNEAPEGLSLSNATVDENSAGAVVGDLSLTDVDDGDSHTFAVDDARFEVVGGQLKLKDGAELNHEEASSINVTVTATDNGGLSTNETFSIAVGDVNEAPEALSLSNTTIDENVTGAVIGDLSLTDVDDGDSHSYSVDDARFEVVGGQLKLKDGVALQNEDAASVDVTVTATDSGGLTTNETFTIDVTDHDQVINGSPDPVTSDIGQVGTVTVGQASSAEWHSVAFDQPIADAVVVMSAMTQNGGDPFTVRVRNVTEDGFEFQIDEWDYLDGYHVTETLSWMAVEEGVHTLENGQTIYAGNETVDSSGRQIMTSRRSSPTLWCWRRFKPSMNHPQ